MAMLITASHVRLASIPSVALLRPCTTAVRPRRVAARAETDEKAGEAKPITGSDGTFYNDERPLPKKEELSAEYKKKLRDEYLSLGGSPDTPMGQNWFLWISVFIGTLALLSYFTGAI